LALCLDVKKLEDEFNDTLSKLPFYRLLKPQGISITADLIEMTKICIKRYGAETLLPDSHFSFDHKKFGKLAKDLQRYKHTLFHCQRIFASVVDFYKIDNSEIGVLLFGTELLSDLIKQVSAIDSFFNGKFSLEHRIQIMNKNPVLIDVYDIETLSQFLYQEFIQLLKHNLKIKVCANCGRLFIVFSGHSLEYCDNIPTGETKPCSLIGSARLYVKNLKKDPILENYTRTYKTHYSRINAGHITHDEFKAWSKEAKVMRKKTYDGEISLDDFIAWSKM
jgi:hypothetical protein